MFSSEINIIDKLIDKISLTIYGIDANVLLKENEEEEVVKVKKQLTTLDSLATKKDLEIEGLKAEKRMIQATDRKMLDVQRQSEIDVELKKLGAH